MDILILNSSNLPEGLENELKNVDGESPDVKSEDIELKPNQSDFDLFIHKELQRIFSDKHNYDLIILPYSFSLDNYTEFTGLTTALHIRLTLQWEMTRVPLLFIGPDPKEEVERFSPYGLLLETSSVYTTNLKDSANLYEFIKTLGVHPLSNSQYQTFRCNRRNYLKISHKAFKRSECGTKLRNYWELTSTLTFLSLFMMTNFNQLEQF